MIKVTDPAVYFAAGSRWRALDKARRHADVMRLEDYEEGTWVPTSQHGSYTKIGTMIEVDAIVTITSPQGDGDGR